MGHVTSGNVYRKLGRKIDSLSMRAPWTETLYEILKELYTEEEASFVVRMPYSLSGFRKIKRVTGYDKKRLRRILDRLSAKGLVMDLKIRGSYYYMPSPIVIGVFEFSMMRTGGVRDIKKLARLFHTYLQEEDAFQNCNFNGNNNISFMRTLPHEETIVPSEYTEVLDYEKASVLIQEAERFSVGICSCRHEKLHLGEKTCDVPLDTCSSFGMAADFLVRNNLAREVCKAEMLDNLARSKEMGLVLNADNVQNRITYICHCCGCCCNVLLGISKYGYSNIVVTSGFIAEVDESLCKGCGKCADSCHIHIIEMVPSDDIGQSRKIPSVDKSLCLGCGVCVLNCQAKAISLVRRSRRVITPETTFERIMLQSLEKGNLQYQIFDNPCDITQKVMRAFLGAFLRLPPVKKALLSNLLRSSFLEFMKKGSNKQGRSWLTEI